MAGKIGGSSLISKSLYSLEGIGVRSCNSLYLQKNKLTSFEHYGIQPHVQNLYLEDNCISSFCGLEMQPKLENIWLLRNPITSEPHYRIMCLLVVGPTLKKIDDLPITNLERWQAKRLGPFAAKIIRLGWILPSLDLSPSEIEAVYQEQLSLHIENFRNSISSTPHALPPPKPSSRPSSPSMLTRASGLNTHHNHTPKSYHKLIPPLKLIPPPDQDSFADTP